MSYFKSNGASVAQAAGGLGVTPTAPFSHGVMAARTMGDPSAVACSARFAPGSEEYADCVAMMQFGTGANAAETPNVVGGQFGTETHPFRDGVFSRGTRSDRFGGELSVFRDGIFGGPMYGMGAAGGVLDLRDKESLKQFKMMLRSVDPNLPAADIDIPWWTPDTETTWHTAVYAAAIKTNTPPATAGTWNQKVGGVDVPTALGAYAVFGYAIQGVPPNYPATYWPLVAAWVSGGGTAISAPRFGKARMSTMAMVGLGAGAALAVLGGLWIMKKKRGAHAATI